MVQNNLTRDEAVTRAGLVDNVSYDVDLDLTAGADRFVSRTNIRFTCRRPGESTFLDLLADEVTGIEVNGRARPLDAFTGDRIRLDDLEKDNHVTVSALCPYDHNGVGLHRFVDPTDERAYLHTQFEPFDAHRVYTCFDQPDIKAPFTLQVTAPADWTVVSNGAPLEHPSTGDRPAVWRFSPTPPISTYITALVAGPYQSWSDRHGDVDLGIYCRQSLAQFLDVEDLWEITHQGLDFFAAQYGRPYPFGKYDQLFVPEFNAGAMENAGCVTFSESYVFRSKITEAAREQRANTILHEMAHMWFGDLVTMRWWDDLWLNESFATYMASLASAEATRFRQAWVRFANSMKAWAYAEDQLPSTHPISADIVDTESVRLHFDGISYAKGASVLRQLVAWVGRDGFERGVRHYFDRNEWRNAELADFLDALEHTSGRPLAGWSKDWLETAGVNTLRLEVEDDGSSYTRARIVQSAPSGHPTLRSHRLGIGLYRAGGQGLALADRFEVDVSGPATDLPEMLTRPVADLVLLNDGDLAYAKIRIDPRSFQTAIDHLSSLDDPLARNLCWAAAWDMVRDAELAMTDFVALTVRHLAQEDDPATVARIAAQALSGVDVYADPGRRGGNRAELATAFRSALLAAPPSSDNQLTWARSWISAVEPAGNHGDTGADPVAGLEALLDGSAPIDGLDVDIDLRWHLVATLCRLGRGDEHLVEAELDRDPTDIGRRRAAACLAARPTADAKEAAWRSLLTDLTLPLATIRAMGTSFHQPGQVELSRPYIARYLEALPGLWADRERDVAITLTEALFPSTVVEPSTWEAVNATMDSAGDALPGPCRRILSEGVDQLQRQARARAVDAGA